MNWKKHEQNQKNINYRKLYETRTHTQTNGKWKEQWQELKQNGREKQCKENDSEQKKREKDMKASYLHGKWNDMFRVGRSDNVCDNQCHQNLFVTLSWRLSLEMRKGWPELECGPYIQILNSWPNHTNLCFGAFSEGFCIQAMVAGCCGFCCVLAVCDSG